MMRIFACLALVGGLAPWLVPAQAVSAIRQANDRKETERLIEQLGDKQFPLRNQAFSRLEKMGPSILPQLRTALGKSSDPEARRHLESLIPKMEQQVALEPTRITLNLKDASLTKAAEELSKQCGYKIDIYRGGGADPEQRSMTLQVQNATFWEAIAKLCEAGGYTLHEYYGPDTRTIRLMPGDHYPGTLYLSGAFRVMLRGFYHYRTMDFANGRNGGGVPELRRSESLSVNFSISAEPKMPLLGAGYPTITDAVDDQGQSIRLPPQTRPQQTYYHGYRSYMHNVQAQLGPSANGKRLKVLKGTIPVTVVATQRPQITIEKLADVKSQTFKQGTTTLFIESVSYTGSQTHIKMNVTEGGRNNGADHSWSQTFLQRMEVTDEKGNKLQNYGGNWSGGVNSLQGTFQFGSPGNGGKGVKLVLYEWATVTHNVPFEFEDVPLP